MRLLAMLLLLLGVSACSLPSNESTSTPAERATSEQAIASIRAGDLAAIDRSATEAVRNELTQETLDRIRESLPEGTPVLQAVTAGAPGFKSLNYAVGRDDRWAVVQITLEANGGQARIAGFNVKPSDRSPVAMNDFTLAGKSLAHWLWLVAMAAAVSVSVYACVQIVRTPGLRYKWLWAAGSLVSFVSFSLDWTSGAMRVVPLSVQLLGVGAWRMGPLSPWLLSFAIPVVALAFLFLRDSLVARGTEPS